MLEPDVFPVFELDLSGYALEFPDFQMPELDAPQFDLSDFDWSGFEPVFDFTGCEFEFEVFDTEQTEQAARSSLLNTTT